MEGLLLGDDGKHRCWWCGDAADYNQYHDEEWGNPVTDNFRLFEKVSLEGFQAGLSWLTILRKRENFRAAFDGFDYHKIAKYSQNDIGRMLGDESIIRHRGKIEAVLNNAARAIEMEREYGSLAAYFWSWEPDNSDRPVTMNYETALKLDKTPASTLLAKDLKKRGWKFVGPTTCYAFMQAMGMVNDHLEGCHRRAEIERKRLALKRPLL